MSCLGNSSVAQIGVMYFMRISRRLTWAKTMMASTLCLVSATVFADVVDDLIDDAFQNYPGIKSKQMSQKSAEKEVLAAKLNFLPTITISAQPATRNYGDVSAANRKADPVTVISVKQPLLGGGLYSRLQMSKAKKSMADWTVEESRRDIAVRVINAYSQWFAAHSKLEASNESVIAHEKFTELITRRMQSGISTQSDVNQSQSRLGQARAEQASYRSAEFTALVALNQLVGRQLSREELKRGALEEVNLPNDIIAQAIAVSPTIHRLEYAAQVAEHQAGVTKAQAYPTLSLKAERTINSTTNKNYGTVDSVGLTAEYSSSNGFSSLVQGSAADDQYKAALLDVDTARRDLVVQINQDVSEYEFAKVRRQSLAKTVELTQSVSESYDRLFRVGKKSWLDLLNAVRERTQTLSSLADVDASLLATSRRLKIYTTLQGSDEDTK